MGTRSSECFLGMSNTPYARYSAFFIVILAFLRPREWSVHVRNLKDAQNAVERSTCFLEVKIQPAPILVERKPKRRVFR